MRSLLIVVFSMACFTLVGHAQVAPVKLPIFEQIKDEKTLENWRPKFPSIWNFWTIINQACHDGTKFEAFEFSNIYVVCRCTGEWPDQKKFEWSVYPMAPTLDWHSDSLRLAFIGNDGKPIGNDISLPETSFTAVTLRAECKVSATVTKWSEIPIKIRSRQLPPCPAGAVGLMCAFSYHLKDDWIGRGQVVLPLQPEQQAKSK